ncbi:hypothetical protein [Candidatus Brocadia sapporoensis]|uniref:hypothetical protein n=1 Tax=Candidatus Brocadia sapporoensis TaxID=392547 RepID=UPI00117851DF|nr:hypothetical protein [Candidatus Brocadia sapporoensis]MDG6005328.1 hypothetical protein [Candidatus Brocadia sp.]
MSLIHAAQVKRLGSAERNYPKDQGLILCWYGMDLRYILVLSSVRLGREASYDSLKDFVR